MTPEEKFNKSVLYVLKKIKERLLYTKQDELIEYQVKFYGYHDPAAPLPENEAEILEKLQERGVIQIKNKEDVKVNRNTSPEAQIFYLGIIQPEFDKFCKKWEEIDENPWLSEGSRITQRKKLLKGQQKQPEEKIDNNDKFYAEMGVKEIKRQLEELNKRQKAFEELGKQISSRIQKDFNAPFQYLKYYGEVSKKISEQLALLKDALERVGRAQQVVKISLNPALQRLVPSLKQLEEQIKNFNELYKAPKHSLSEAIISPDLIKLEQRNQIISEIRNLRKSVEELQTKDAKKKQEPIRVITKDPLTIKQITNEKEIKGFEEKVFLQKSKNKRIELRQFPKDLKWEEITMQFLNEHEVIIKAKNETYQTTYEAMGFQDEKKKLPNKQWQFLLWLTVKKGEVSWDNNYNLSLKQINSIKKQKQLLSEVLKAYFQIDEDPFYPYKQEKSYKIKINLMPETGSQDKQQNDLEIENEYKKQTPSVYDKYEQLNDDEYE